MKRTSLVIAVMALCVSLAFMPASAFDFTLRVFGNANMDDTIDEQDVEYVRGILDGTKDETELADANYDEVIDEKDIDQIELIINGEERELTVLDLGNRTVTINMPVERVVLASARSLLEFVAVEGGENPFKRIVGWGPDLKAYDRDTYDKYAEKFPEIETIPEVGYHYTGTFSVEKVITLDPDVVLFPFWIANYEGVDDDINKLKEAGIPVIYTDYYINPFENIVPSTLLLGYILDREERAQDIVDFHKEKTNEIYSRIEKIDKPKPKVYLECGWKGPSEYGSTNSKAGYGEMIPRCGGINIAEGLPEESSINPEYLLDENPDVIIISGSYYPDTPDAMRIGYYANSEESRELLKGFTNRSGWDLLDAVKNNRVYGIFVGFSFHINYFAGIQALAKWFYPEEFEDIDPEESLREFHERFLPVDYNGVWMLSLEK